MQLDEAQEKVVQKVGHYTGPQSRVGLKLSKIQPCADWKRNLDINELIENNILKQVDGVETVEVAEPQYQLTEKGWEVYDGGD